MPKCPWTKTLHFLKPICMYQSSRLANPCNAGHVAAHVTLLGKQSGSNNGHADTQDCSLCFLLCWPKFYRLICNSGHMHSRSLWHSCICTHLCNADQGMWSSCCCSLKCIAETKCFGKYTFLTLIVKALRRLICSVGLLMVHVLFRTFPGTMSSKSKEANWPGWQNMVLLAGS